jgi:uncharacterized protein YndB with AHSA1/START domain/uncharacterized protein YciI
MSTPNRSRARSVADVTQGLILASVEIAVPIQRVFRALTDGDEITKWWGAEGVYRTTSWKSDFRVGGKWRADGVGADGHAFFVEGEFLEIEPPRKVVQTWTAAWDGGNTTTITYLLDETPEGTRVTVRHTGFDDRVDSCRGHGAGWELVLGWLTAYVGPSASELRAFFCRLVAPRPTFAMDMTEEERAVMKEHAAYWRQHLALGTIVVFGPVLDPGGPWGLGVLRAPSDDAVRAFQSQDPVILSNRGFRYETLPMAAAVYRD